MCEHYYLRTDNPQNMSLRKRVIGLYVVVLVFAFGISGCAFNPFFYYPDKRPVTLTDSLVEEIYLESKSGNKVHTIFYKRETPIATIFILHGNARNLQGWSHTARKLHDLGFQTFMMDYQGFGNSEGKPSHKNVIADAQIAFDYLLNRKEVQSTKIIVLGFSLGGNLAVRIASDNADKIDALAIEGAFTGHRAIAIGVGPRLLKFVPFLLAKNAINGKKLIASIDLPKLIIHSTEDKIIPYKMGQDFYEHASEPRELWTISGPHIRGLWLFEAEYVKKLEALITK